MGLYIGFSISPIKKSEMRRRVEALDHDFAAKQAEAWDKRISEPRSFSMSDLVVMTGRAQEHLINLEKDGKIPRARRIGKKRFYRWSESQARLIIAIAQALPHKK